MDEGGVAVHGALILVLETMNGSSFSDIRQVSDKVNFEKFANFFHLFFLNLFRP